jgi:hypothetical protein
MACKAPLQKGGITDTADLRASVQSQDPVQVNCFLRPRQGSKEELQQIPILVSLHASSQNHLQALLQQRTSAKMRWLHLTHDPKDGNKCNAKVSSGN